MYIIIFPHLLSINYVYCSEAEEDFGVCRYGLQGKRLPLVDCQLWSLSAAMLLRVLDLVFCKTLFGNNYYIL
jgi:hypothetical protein